MSMSNPTPSHVPIDPAATPLGRGASIGRYVVLGLVGRGGMGEVYAAYDPELDRKVAVKLLRVKAGNGVSLTEGRQRTLREAQAIARLSHPNVVVVYDVGTFEDKVFIAMEFVDGNTVTFWLEQKPRTWQEILRVFIAAGRGLIAAHEKGLVHRDFKPDNVMVGRDGQVRVMDFGLARQMDKPGIQEHRPRATPSKPDRGDVEVGTGTLPLDRRGTLVLNPAQGDSARHAVVGLRPVRRAPHPHRRDDGNAGVHGARAVLRQGDRRADRSVQLLRGALRGALRRAAVPGEEADRADRERRAGDHPRGAGRDEGSVLGAADPAARAAVGAGRAVPVDGGAAGGAREGPARDTAEVGGLARRWRCCRWRSASAFARAWSIDAPSATARAEKLAGSGTCTRPTSPRGPRQSQIHAAFVRTGKSYAADVYETVTPRA